MEPIENQRCEHHNNFIGHLNIRIGHELNTVLNIYKSNRYKTYAAKANHPRQETYEIFKNTFWTLNLLETNHNLI